MQTYTVHEPRFQAGADIEKRAGELVFVKEGFSLWAFLVPWLWFPLNRLWWGFIAYILASSAIAVLLSLGGMPESIIFWAGWIINLIFAFEARDFLRRKLERRDYELKGVVSGRDLEECELRYLQEWLPDARAYPGQLTVTPPIGGPALTKNAAQSEPVIGMFPSASR